VVDIDDFRAEHDAALKAANTFAKRARKGTPADRWASTAQLRLVAQGIHAMQQIMAMQTEALETISENIIAAGEESMSLGQPRK
jgi:hypothetical protein